MSKMTLMIFILLTNISCERRNPLEVAFENQLPQTDQVILNEIVNSYDAFIKHEFKGNTKTFLLAIKLNKKILDKSKKQAYCELVKMFDESTLELKSQNVHYDSVYVSESGNIITIAQPEDITEDDLYLDEEIFIVPASRTIEEETEEIKKRDITD